MNLLIMHLSEPKQMFWIAAVLFSSQFHYAIAQSPQDIQQLFEVDQIVPDLLPSFNPVALLEVTYNAAVIPGQILSQNATANRPDFGVEGAPANTSEFIVDPDNQPIPNPNKTFSQFLHFIAPGMTLSNSTDSQGFRKLVNNTPAIVDYLGPGAKTGSPLHRYVLLLYSQPANFSKLNVSAPATRQNFNLTQFEKTMGVVAPIGGNTFLVGDSTSGPSSVPSSNTTATSSAPPASSTTATSSSSRINLAFEVRLSILLLVCGLVFYSY